MIKKYPILLKVINDTYDLILIDEYQDTNKEIVDTFINFIGNGKTIIGLFGDDMQAIYKDGVGNVEQYVEEDKIAKIQKSDNFRCSKQVINFLNIIREDLKQEIALKESENIEERQGSVKLYYKIDCTKPALHSRNNQEEKENYINNLDSFLNAVINQVKTEEKEYKILLLSNSALSKKLHFENLYNIFVDKNIEVKDEIEKLCTKLGWLDLAEMYLYFNDEQYKNHNRLIHCLKQNKYLIEKQEDKTKVVNVFQQIEPERHSISQVLELLVKNKMYNKSENREEEIEFMKDKIEKSKFNKELIEFINNYKKNNSLSKMEKAGITITQEDFDYYKILMNDIKFYKRIVKENIKFSEIVNYKKYLDEKLQYLTMHKTKGTSIENVIVVLDEYFWGTYDFEKLIRNEDSSTLENTRKLFYVACSRAKKDLVIVRVIKPEEEAELLKYFNEDICHIFKYRKDK